MTSAEWMSAWLNQWVTRWFLGAASRTFCCWGATQDFHLLGPTVTYITLDFAASFEYQVSCGRIPWPFYGSVPGSWAGTELIFFFPEWGRLVLHSKLQQYVHVCCVSALVVLETTLTKDFPTVMFNTTGIWHYAKILNIIRIALTCLVLDKEPFFLKGILTTMPFCTKVIDLNIMSKCTPNHLNY